ncbi:HTH-type transcriptional regulator BetI [uncultured archaeon]|nr:HTH-type transcriptional regulator BetI [uncultured archaeon]
MNKPTRDRVTKSSEERRQELIDTAERLFMERGYEQTAVSDIVREVEVAQGTFYYYFSSKEEILEAIIEKDIAALEENVRLVMSKEDISPAEKLNAIINAAIGINASRKDIMDYLHLESNAVMHEKMERHTIERLVPLMAKVIAAGTMSKQFDVDHPKEFAEFLLASLVYFFHHPEIFSDPQRKELMQSTLESILNRSLAAKDYRFTLKV